MNLLVTGAWQGAKDGIEQLKMLGHQVQFLQFEKDELPCSYEWVEGVICNGLFLSHPIERFTHLKYIQLTSAGFDRVDMQYLYSDGDLYNFMDVNTYEQVALNQETIGDALKFVKENEMCKICSYNGKVFSVEPPLFVELEITDTEPGFKGDTATGATKPAVVETGATVYVPLFVNQGDKIKIDTRTGEYLSRV